MLLLKRLSNIRLAQINSIDINSVVQIGDTINMEPKVKVLAIQREHELFYGREGSFENYQLFHETIPQPSLTEKIEIAFVNESPTIHVNHVKVLAASSSSVIQFGSANHIKGESRIKHIRQLKG